MSITVARTFDPAVIGSVMRIPEIYDLSSDDNSKPLPEYQPEEAASDPHTYHMACYNADALMGLCIFRVKAPVWCDAHTAFLPDHRAKPAAIAARDCIKWIFHNTPMQIIRAKIPAFNKRAIGFARLAGLTYIGMEKNSFIKNGVMFDMKVLGIKKHRSNL